MDIMYYAGRIFQLIGLIAMPFAIWVGFLGHNERGCITIFTASGIIFLIGYFLTRWSKK